MFKIINLGLKLFISIFSIVSLILGIFSSCLQVNAAGFEPMTKRSECEWFSFDIFKDTRGDVYEDVVLKPFTKKKQTKYRDALQKYRQ